MMRAWPLESATPLLVAPPSTCERCGCHLSRYRSLLESRCAPCQRAEPAAEPASRAATDTAPRIVLAVLEAGPLAARDIAAQTGLTTPTVKDVLRRLRAQGIVTTGGPYARPVYQLT
jgi:CRP-like cAMP-binding protein